MRYYMPEKSARRQGGFMLIMLIIALAIGLIVYLMMIRTVMPDIGNERNRPARVWEEDWRLDPCSPERIAAAKKAGKYLAAKPAILEKLSLDCPVTLKDQPRGKTRLAISPDGSIKGSWIAQYKHGDIEYDIAADFAGITDPTRQFEESGTLKPELLYYICRGNYAQKSWDTKNEVEGRQKGIIYVDGWFDGRAATGQITLTTDRTWSAVYQYSTAR